MEYLGHAIPAVRIHIENGVNLLVQNLRSRSKLQLFNKHMAIFNIFTPCIFQLIVLNLFLFICQSFT